MHIRIGTIEEALVTLTHVRGGCVGVPHEAIIEHDFRAYFEVPVGRAR